MQDDRFLTKIFDSSKGPQPPSDSGTTSVPSMLLQQGGRRIPLVAAAALCVQILGWVIPLTARGAFLEEFTRVWDWVPPCTAIAASAALIVASKGFEISPQVLVRLGLVYQVVISYSVTFSQYWNAFSDVTADHINGDIVGMTVVAVWMVFYTVIVPARPRHALVALLGSSSAPGVVYFLSMNAGDAPALEGQHFFFVFVFPYLLVASCAYIAALIVYRLGQAVSAAREMGSYRLEDRLGEGGMGEVWRASHRMLARPAAVKLVRADSLGWDQDTAVARFEREAQVTAALQSPHTVELYDYGVSENGTIYYVMELLDGIDLDELVKKHGALPAERVVHILKQICASLSEAHRRDLIHRDVKPANIFLCKRAFHYDFVKVLDFGLVRKQSTVDPEAPENELSQIGMVMGTPAYIAPEVINGDPADARSDIYAVGCVAYWLLTGKKVFDSPTLAALLVAHASKEPVPPSKRAAASIPADLDALVLDCLKKDPDDRVQGADEIVARLRGMECGDPWTQGRAESWWGVMA